MTYDYLIEARDWAERAVYELREELLEHCAEEDWDDSMVREMNDAENELAYIQERIDTGDFTDD